MAETVLINAGPGETRVAILSGGKLEEFYLERTVLSEGGRGRGRAGHSVLGNIILGRVQRVLPGMQAAFVDIGLEKAGFLGAREAQCLSEVVGLAEGELPPIASCVREGELILVQVVKDPINEKGARLSANVTIPGRLLVLVPNQEAVALSRRIVDEAERTRLTALVGGLSERGRGRTLEKAGYIVRTAALAATEAEIVEDAARLAADWRAIGEKRKTAKAPATLYLDLDPVARTLRDGVDVDTVRVLIDDPEAFAEARSYAERAMPEALPKLELHRGAAPLFESFGVELELDRLLEPRASLPSGGWITIEHTEALTAIDVNSGSLTATTGLEETSLRTNLEAAAEIGRQIRLRGIGGLVVIDFIHMADPANAAAVVEILEKSLSRDRTPTQILPMSEFGLVELTRKRTREPIAKLLTEPCPDCPPRGRVKTVPAVANDLLRRIEREARARPGEALTAYAAPDVVAWLEANAETVIANLIGRVGDRVRLAARPAFARETIDVG